MDKLNCKTQAHGRVYEEHKLEEKIQHLLKQFCGKRCEFIGSHRKSGETDQDDILKNDSP